MLYQSPLYPHPSLAIYLWQSCLPPMIQTFCFHHNYLQILFCVRKFRRMQTTMMANQTR
jgi:hypothetical protein